MHFMHLSMTTYQTTPGKTVAHLGQPLIIAFQSGWFAAKVGKGNNPYPEDSEEYAQWWAGYRKYVRDANA